MPFKNEDMAGSHYTKAEAAYLADMEEAQDVVLYAEQAIPSSEALRDVDRCRDMGETIAHFAHAAKCLRVLAEAAVKDSRLQHEQAGVPWQGFSLAEAALDRAIDAEGRAMRWFSAWVMDAESTLDSMHS